MDIHLGRLGIANTAACVPKAPHCCAPNYSTETTKQHTTSQKVKWKIAQLIKETHSEHPQQKKLQIQVKPQIKLFLKISNTNLKNSL